MSNPDDLLDILNARLAGRVSQLVDSNNEPNERDIADLANHYSAVKAVEWFIKEYSGFLK